MNNGEKEYAALQPADFAKLANEIGEQFGYSSLHCIAFEQMQCHINRLKTLPPQNEGEQCK